MKRFQISVLSVLFFIMISMSSCEAIGSIFKAGIWTGVIVVVAIVALILYFVSRGRK